MPVSAIVEPGIGSWGDIATLVEDLLPYPVPNQAGYSQTTCTSTTWSGDSIQSGSSPPVQVGDVFYASLVTSPSGYAVTINGDGTYEISCMGDNSRQSFQYEVFRIASNTLDGPATEWINAVAPMWGYPVVDNAMLIGTPFSLNLAQALYATSPEGDALTFSLLTGSLPPGLTLSSAGLLSGTPTGGGPFFSFTIAATDSANLTTPSAACYINVVTSLPGGGGNIIYPAAISTNFNVPKARPSTRIIDDRSLCFGMSGAELAYPVYQFSGNRVRWEFPGHNPFEGL